jgi:hypothetical protein
MNPVAQTGWRIKGFMPFGWVSTLGWWVKPAILLLENFTNRNYNNLDL